MDMNNKLLHDKNTNVVFLSPCLNTKKYGNPKFYKELMTILKEMGIETRELKCTRDYWARDYMPIQLGENDFLKYHYYPDYLINKDDIDSITDVSKVISGMGINCRSTNLIIDGGNMVPCGPYIVMTDKVFSENRKRKDDTDFKALLESEIGHPVIIIPWTQHEDDVFGVRLDFGGRAVGTFADGLPLHHAAHSQIRDRQPCLLADFADGRGRDGLPCIDVPARERQPAPWVRRLRQTVLHEDAASRHVLDHADVA
jgi:hypothetical protein